MISRSPTDPKPEIQGRALLLLQITWFKCTRKSSNELFNKLGVKDSILEIRWKEGSDSILKPRKKVLNFITDK